MSDVSSEQPKKTSAYDLQVPGKHADADSSQSDPVTELPSRATTRTGSSDYGAAPAATGSRWLKPVLFTAAGLAALWLAFAVGYSVAHKNNRTQPVASARSFSRGSGGYGGGYASGDGTRGSGYGRMNQMGQMGGMNGTNNAGNSSSRVQGVVTAIDGTTLTVAGNGTTVQVKLTDDTNYSGADKPAKVNDTIMAFGTTTDGVLTAASVRLVRQ